MVDRLVNMTNVNLDSLRVDTTSWADQFRNAMNVNGGDLEGASHLDYFMHFMTFGFKVHLHFKFTTLYADSAVVVSGSCFCRSSLRLCLPLTTSAVGSPSSQLSA